MKKKLLSTLLAICMIITLLPVMAMAAPAFPDMPKDYSTTALENAVVNGLLKGAEGKILPDANLKRAEMAAVTNRAFGAAKQADITKFKDVAATAWYFADMCRAVQMQTLKGDGVKLNPEAFITREQSFAVLARSLKLKDGTAAELSAFSDAGSVSTWAIGTTAAMIKSGFVHGADGKINPQAYISRKDFAVVMDNIIKNYITTAGEVTSVKDGTVMVNVPGVTLKNLNIKGDLIIGDGVGDGDITLDNVKVSGRTIIRGGGVNSVIVRGSSDLGSVTVSKMDGAVRVSVQGDAKVQVVYIDDGKDDVFIEGKVGAVTVSTDTPVTLRGADVKTVTATGENADITVDKNSKVETVASSSPNTTVTVAGTVTTVAGTKEAGGLNVNVSAGGTATNVVTAAPNTTLTNDGKVGQASFSADAAGAKIVVGSASTIGKVVNENKANLTVTTAAAEKAAKAEAAAKAAADKAAADKIAAEIAAANAKTEAEKAAAAAAQKAADEAAAKAAAEAKAAADAAAAAKAEADKVQEETNKKTEVKPVEPPKAEGGGTVTVPEQPKPVPPIDPPVYVDPYTDVKTEAELKTAAVAGANIKLTANIELSEAMEIPTPASLNTDNYALDLKGQNFTLSGTAASTCTISGTIVDSNPDTEGSSDSDFNWLHLNNPNATYTITNNNVDNAKKLQLRVERAGDVSINGCYGYVQVGGGQKLTAQNGARIEKYLETYEGTTDNKTQVLLKDGSYTARIANDAADDYTPLQTISIEGAAIYAAVAKASGILSVDTGVCVINKAAAQNGTILKQGDAGYIAVPGFAQNFVYKSLEEAYYHENAPMSSTFYFPAGNYTVGAGNGLADADGAGLSTTPNNDTQRFYAESKIALIGAGSGSTTIDFGASNADDVLFIGSTDDCNLYLSDLATTNLNITLSTMDAMAVHVKDTTITTPHISDYSALIGSALGSNATGTYTSIPCMTLATATRFAKPGDTIEILKNIDLTAGYIYDKVIVPEGVTLHIPADKTITLSADGFFTNNGTINNEGTITIENGKTLTNNGTINNNGTLTNNGIITNSGVGIISTNVLADLGNGITGVMTKTSDTVYTLVLSGTGVTSGVPKDAESEALAGCYWASDEQKRGSEEALNTLLGKLTSPISKYTAVHIDYTKFAAAFGKPLLENATKYTMVQSGSPYLAVYADDEKLTEGDAGTDCIYKNDKGWCKRITSSAEGAAGSAINGHSCLGMLIADKETPTLTFTNGSTSITITIVNTITFA